MFLFLCEIHVLLVLFFEHSDFVCMMHGTVCALIQYIVIYICFEFEEKKKHILFFQLRRVR